MASKSQKIFCIGLNKTGTTSLHLAFKKLGYKSVHFRTKQGLNIKDVIANNYKNGKPILDQIDHFDAYSDWNHPTTNFLYKEFDKAYPNSKFILNTRAMDDWIESRTKHVKRLKNLETLQQQHPGHPWYHMDIEAWKKEYDVVHKDILDYFKTRPNDLLVFNLTEGDEWQKLCTFLDAPIPNTKFPKSNTASSFNLFKKLKLKFKVLLHRISNYK